MDGGTQGAPGLENEEFPDDVPLPAFQPDMGLSPLQAVVEWAADGNPPAQRVAYILSIPAAAAESSLEEARNVLLPLLSQLAFDDHPDIKQATAEVLGRLGPILAGKDPEAQGPEGSTDAMDLLVLSHRLLQDPERGVQEAAATSVAQFAGLLSHEHRRDHLSAVVDALMHNFDDEQMQECAVDLLTKVTAVAGPEHPGWCEECAVPRLLKLALHRDYGIRLHSVAGLVQLSACLPEEERAGPLLSAFADLAADQVWSVRQECANELSNLAASLPRAAVRDKLLPLWQSLACDTSSWVQAAARRQAGPLLASLHPEDSSGAPALLAAFVEAAAGPATLTEACAHYLPAVLRNLGPQGWTQLREATTLLAASEYGSVRVALAESMHVLAALLGPEVMASDLLPALQRLSVDEHPAVADALACHISSLLAALPPGERLPQLGFLARMHPEDGSSCGQWRMRLVIAEQLSSIAALLEPQGMAEVLLPATLRLCEDPVAAVREAAAAQLGGMVRGLLAEASTAPSRSASGQGQVQEQVQVQEGAEDGGEEGAAQPGEQQPQPPQQQQQGQEQQQQEGAACLADRLQHIALADASGSAAAAAADNAGEGLPQQQAAGPVSPSQPALDSSTPAAAGDPAAAGGAGAPPTAAVERQQEEEEEEEEEEVEAEPPTGQPALAFRGRLAMVQQIVRHIVELQRSGCHRSRQTYLQFCSALLLPAPSAPPPALASPGAAAASPSAAGEQPQEQQLVAAPNGAADPPSPGAQPPWPALPAGVADSGVVQGLLEGAVALSADPVPNVRLAVARLLAALSRQQPALAGSSPKVTDALISLAADSDRDVQQAAAS